MFCRKFKNNKCYKFRPERKFSGLLFLFLFFTISDISSSENESTGSVYLTDMMRDIIYRTTDINREDSFDTSRITFKTRITYSNILRYKKKNYNYVKKRMAVYNIDFQNHIGVRYKNFKVLIDYSLLDRNFTLLDTSILAASDEDNTMHRITGRLYFFNENVCVGVLTGLTGSSVIPEYVEIKEDSYLQPISTVFEDNRLILGIQSKFRYDKIFGEISLYEEPQYIDVIKIKSQQSGGMKRMPLYIYKNSASYTLGIGNKTAFIEKHGSLDKYSSDSFVASQDTFPFNTSFLNYTTALDIGFGAVETGINYHKFSGDLYGHSQYLTYLKAQYVEIRNLKYKASYKTKKKNILSIFGEHLKGQLPQGDSDMSPFTSWSIFHPLAYRIKNAGLNFSDFGLLGILNKEWSRNNYTNLIFCYVI